MMVAMISFDGPTLDWYRAHDEREPFPDWADLKHCLLI